VRVELTPAVDTLSTGESPPIANQPLFEALPDSQQSSAPVSYGAYTAPSLLPSSSDVSNVTVPDTELTSPISPDGHPRQPQDYDATQCLPQSPMRPRDRSAQDIPRVNTDISLRTGDTAASPMSIDRPPLTQGSKRTASGVVKNKQTAGDSPSTSVAAPSPHKRHISVDSATGLHIGQVRLLSICPCLAPMAKIVSCSYPHNCELGSHTP
jgi:hypothetical protein